MVVDIRRQFVQLLQLQVTSLVIKTESAAVVDWTRGSKQILISAQAGRALLRASIELLTSVDSRGFVSIKGSRRRRESTCLAIHCWPVNRSRRRLSIGLAVANRS